MKRAITILMICCMLLTCAVGCKKDSDTPIFSTKKANDDFSDLFKTAAISGDALAAVTVTKVETVTDLIEYYDVIDTTYTKVTATLDREFTSQIKETTLTLYILGSEDNFPSREVMVEGRSYLLRLESWVHESGIVWLISPLESTYLRIFQNEILVHESATDLNYKKALSPDAFAAQYTDYLKAHPLDPAELQKHYNEILTTLSSYNYTDEQLKYRPSEKAIAARKQLAQQLQNHTPQS